MLSYAFEVRVRDSNGWWNVHGLCLRNRISFLSSVSRFASIAFIFHKRPPSPFSCYTLPPSVSSCLFFPTSFLRLCSSLLINGRRRSRKYLRRHETEAKNATSKGMDLHFSVSLFIDGEEGGMWLDLRHAELLTGSLLRSPAICSEFCYSTGAKKNRIATC